MVGTPQSRTTAMPGPRESEPGEAAAERRGVIRTVLVSAAVLALLASPARSAAPAGEQDPSGSATVDLTRLAGVTRGAGATAAARIDTAKALQAAIDLADANGLELACPAEVVIEFDSAAGLVVPVSTRGFRARLNQRCQFRQFHRDAPVLTIGDPRAEQLKASVDWEGGELNYGVDQGGQQGASCLVLGALANSVISKLNVCDEYELSGKPLHPPYRNLLVGTPEPSKGNEGFFQNRLSDLSLGGAQYSLLEVRIPGTGVQWEDIYAHNGSDFRMAQPLLGHAWVVDAGHDRSDDTWIRTNFEHLRAANPVFFQNVRTTTMIGTHFEDVWLTGSHATLANFAAARVRMISTYLLDVRTGGTPTDVRLFQLGYGAHLNLDGLELRWSEDREFAGPGAVLFAGNAGRSTPDDAIGFSVADLTVSDGLANAEAIGLEPAIPTTLGVLRHLDRYDYDPLLPRTEGAEFTVGGDFTLYGQHRNPSILVPAGLPGPDTITLSSRFAAPPAASGTVATPPGRGGPRAGIRELAVGQSPVRVRRLSGDSAYATTLRDDAGHTVASLRPGDQAAYARGPAPRAPSR
jgi:hypothetical protein